jgi:hypothetical protein
MKTINNLNINAYNNNTQTEMLANELKDENRRK